MAEDKSLKHLGFVPRYASTLGSAVEKVENLYKGAKAYAPASITPVISRVEDTVVAYTAPALAVAQDTGDKVLHNLDGKVDYVFTKVNSVVDYGKQTLASVGGMHEAQMKTLQAQTKAQLDRVGEIANWVYGKLNPTESVQKAREALDSALAAAKTIADPDQAVKIVYDSWVWFSSIPTVATVLSTADPVVHTTLDSFYKLHDKLVVSPLYKKTVDTSASALGFLASTTPYKLAKSYMYPLVQPLADPAYNRLASSQVVNKMVTYWTPATA